MCLSERILTWFVFPTYAGVLYFSGPIIFLPVFPDINGFFLLKSLYFYDGEDKLHIENFNENLYVVTPHMKHGLTEKEVDKPPEKIYYDLSDRHAGKPVYSAGTILRWLYHLLSPFTRIGYL